MEPQHGRRLAGLALGQEPVEVVDHLRRGLPERQRLEAGGELGNQAAVVEQRGRGATQVLDVRLPGAPTAL